MVKTKNSNIDLKRLVTFYEGQSSSAIFSFLLAGVLFYFHKEINGRIQITWLALQLVCSLIRLIYLKTTGLKLNAKSNILFHERAYVFILSLNGIVWGAAVFTFLPYVNGDTQFLSMLFPIAILVGGITRMNLSKLSAIAYTLSLLVVYDLYFAFNWTQISMAIILGGVLLALFLIKAALVNFDTYMQLQSSLENLQVNFDLEKELNFQKTISMQSSKLASLGEMAGGIAHEVNNPLTIIKMQSDHMIKAYRNGKIDHDSSVQAFSTISETVDRIGKVIQGLLIFSRDKDSVEKTLSTPEEIINDSLALTSEKFRSKKIQVKKVIEEKGIGIEINKIAIAQVIVNLLNNSYFFLKDREDSWIEIKVTRINNFVEISFKDSGDPISDEISEKLFTPFFTSKPVGEGTGLGLSISRSILKDHNGDLQFVKCEHPCFVISLPVNTADIEEKKSA